MVIVNMTPQEINAVLLSMQKEIEALKKRIEELEKENK